MAKIFNLGTKPPPLNSPVLMSKRVVCYLALANAPKKHNREFVIGGDCNSLQAFEAQINLIKSELDALVVEARQLFQP